MSECADPERDWFPQRTVCYSTMALQSAERRYDALHEKEPYHDGTFTSWAKDPDVRHPYGHRDGVTIWIADRDLTPDDDFI